MQKTYADKINQTNTPETKVNKFRAVTIRRILRTEDTIISIEERNNHKKSVIAGIQILYALSYVVVYKKRK